MTKTNPSKKDDTTQPAPTNALGCSKDEFSQMLSSLGQPAFRSKQVLEWLWARHADSYDDMTNLPKDLRETLANVLPIDRGSVKAKQVSSDGTRKYLVAFSDGISVEMVGIPSKDRLTVCISTQAGCAMGCTFCATGVQGLVRNLNCGEIAQQVGLVAADFGMRVSNVVVMGQGEPFANYANVMDALEIINASWGYGIGARHITVSTSGLIEGIRQFAAEPHQYTLAVSLHSAIQKTRDALMPGLRTQKLPDLLHALQEYFATTSRRPSLEYALIAGVSDTAAEIAALGEFASRAKCHVNLIPINVVAGLSARPTKPLEAQHIASNLERTYHVAATIRTERGSDIAAACGQLKQVTSA